VPLEFRKHPLEYRMGGSSDAEGTYRL